MSSTDAPAWWADVQQDREDLGGRRQAESWLDEDLEFVREPRFPRRDRSGADHALHGVFVHAESAPVGRSITLELDPPADELASAPTTSRDAAPPASREVARGDDGRRTGWARWSSHDDGDGEEPVERRTVRVTGRPEARTPSVSRRARRPRTASDRVGPRPDRIVMWVVLLGLLLIILAVTSAGS